MTFDDLTFQVGPIGNRQATAFFPNGYGASVVIGPYTYGGAEGLYELAVLKGKDRGAHLCYDTPITDDVEGHLTPEMVTALLGQIEQLPAAAA